MCTDNNLFKKKEKVRENAGDTFTLHVHDYTGITTCNDGHCHIHPGVTSIPISYGGSHIHQIAGATTYQDGHYHMYNAYTSTAVGLPNGYHTHYNSFSTNFVDGHIHNIMGYVMATEEKEKED
ncbi:MAG TPA: hypothetical protein DEF36_00760 [Desulfotomaculum sp.]|nr:hypothetical protein [Desulfotomaculum sp.]